MRSHKTLLKLHASWPPAIGSGAVHSFTWQELHAPKAHVPQEINKIAAAGLFSAHTDAVLIARPCLESPRKATESNEVPDRPEANVAFLVQEQKWP
jgi:hypothetical protein